MMMKGIMSSFKIIKKGQRKYEKRVQSYDIFICIIMYYSDSNIYEDEYHWVNVNIILYKF